MVNEQLFYWFSLIFMKIVILNKNKNKKKKNWRKKSWLVNITLNLEFFNVYTGFESSFTDFFNCWEISNADTNYSQFNRTRNKHW